MFNVSGSYLTVADKMPEENVPRAGAEAALQDDAFSKERSPKTSKAVIGLRSNSREMTISVRKQAVLSC
jgi:hypothetical protein